MPWGQTKPPLGYGIDGSSPIAPMIEAAWLFNETVGSAIDLKNGYVLPVTTKGWSPLGLNTGPTGSNAGYGIIPGTEHTIITRINPTVFGLVGTYGGRPGMGTGWSNEVTGGNFVCHRDYVANSKALYCGYGGTTALRFDPADTGDILEIGKSVDIAYSNKLGVGRLYKNGRYIAYKNFGTVPVVATSAFSLYADSAAGRSVFEYLFILDKELTGAVLASLSAEPYQMIEGWNYERTFSIPGVSSSSSNSSLSYGGIPFGLFKYLGMPLSEIPPALVPLVLKLRRYLNGAHTTGPFSGVK